MWILKYFNTNSSLIGSQFVHDDHKSSYTGEVKENEDGEDQSSENS